MKHTDDKEAELAYKMGQSWWQQIMAILIGIMLVIAILWVTAPSESERLVNRTCFKKCKVEVERRGLSMSFLGSAEFIAAIEECHDECSSVIR